MFSISNRHTHGGGQEDRHLRFLSSCAAPPRRRVLFAFRAETLRSQHGLYGIQKAPIPNGTEAFLYKRCKEYVLFGLHIQHADRIEYAQHSHAGIGEYGQPHGCDTEQTRIHNEDLDRECKHDVLLGDDIRLAGDLDRDRDGVRSAFMNTTSAASIAASAPLPIAAPTSAPASTGASLMPSPTNITAPRFSRISVSADSLSCGSRRARTSSMPTSCATASALA